MSPAVSIVQDFSELLQRFASQRLDKGLQSPDPAVTEQANAAAESLARVSNHPFPEIRPDGTNDWQVLVLLSIV